MAKIFLSSTDTDYTIGSSNTLVYGNSSNTKQKIILATDVSAITLDANVDGLQLPGMQADYTFAQAGNALKILKDTTVISQIGIQDDADGSQLVFADKAIAAKPIFDLTKGGLYFDLGGTIVNSSAPPSLQTTDKTTLTAGLVLTGRVIDGYVAGATVALTNKDGTPVLDKTGKPITTTTDAQGNFKFPEGTPSGVIVAKGGTDISTGKPFKGELKAPEGSSVITPLTTLQQGFVANGQSAEEAEKSVAKALGFDASKIDLQKYDPIQEVLSSNTKNDTSLAAKIMASNAMVANLLVSAAETLKSASDGKLTTEQISQSFITSLVTNISKDKDGVIDLTDAKFTKEVFVGSSQEFVFSGKLNAAKVDAVDDSFAAIAADSAKKIDAQIKDEKADAKSLLASVGQVSSFIQNKATTELSDAAKTGKIPDSLIENLTGDKATKEIEKIEIQPAKTDAEIKAEANKVTADKAAAEQKTIADAAKQKAIDDEAAEQKHDDSPPAPPSAAPSPPASEPSAPVISTEQTISLPISATGTKDASTAKFLFQFLEGNYQYNISKFTRGDTLQFPYGQTISVSNENFSDGKVNLIWAANGSEIAVTLSELGSQDKSLLFAENINQQFGDSTLSYATVAPPPSSTSTNIPINAEGSFNANLGACHFAFEASNYAYSIANFAAGDTLDFPDSQQPSISNENLKDGSVNLIWAADGKEIVVTLTGLTDQQDAALLFAASFNSVFGTNTLI